MIGAELRLELAHHAAQRRRHDPGIVDDDIQPPAAGNEPVGEFPHTIEISQVHVADLDRRIAGVGAQFCRDLLAGLARTHRHHDMRLGAGERADRFNTDSG